IGVYFLQQGADLKKVDVIYDRANSSFSELRTGMINWDEVLNDCSWFHFSAISPALSEATVALCKEALQAASAKGLTISIDLNYRSKLWQYGKKPEEMMPALLQYCDAVMGNLWAAESLLGISSDISTSTGKSNEDLIAGAVESMTILQKNYPKVKTVAYTFRLEEQYFAAMLHNKEIYQSKVLLQTNIVDRVGSGDCFMAGLIYGILNHKQPEEIINFSGAAAVGKMREKGDSTNQSIDDIKQKF
ncbi:MAG: PfkB family carbohydrate kinase, partial [Chitinophagaceae bacterium]